MQFIFPAMFKDEDAESGYGFGGNKGTDVLANHIPDRLRKVDRSSQSGITVKTLIGKMKFIAYKTRKERRS